MQPRTLRRSVAALSLAVVAGGLAMAAPAQAQTSARSTSCSTVQITGKKVAVRMPDPDDTVADSNDRVTRYVYRGDKLTTCIVAIGRGQTYKKCGRTGYDWYIVRGGQIPVTCAKDV
ncbi:hypothetical protein OHB14_51570 [Streptomyces sp. NBC_01613]|uniref:hypothetical protein n=1 Tax=Streptomyces sp. NBC_01613 TaxID=2975896 RepID=UPI00386A50BF